MKSPKIEIDQIKIFSFLPKVEVQRVGSHFSQRELVPGQVLLNAGDRVAGIYIVARGEINVFTPRSDHLITTLKAGASIGEMSLVDTDKRSSACLKAGDDGAQLGFCPGSVFEEKVLSNDSLALPFYRGLSLILVERLRLTNLRAKDTMDQGIAVVRNALDQYKLHAKVFSVKEDVDSFSSLVIADLKKSIVSLEGLTSPKGSSTEDVILKSVRSTIEKIMLEDMQSFDKIAQKLDLINQFLQNVKRSIDGVELESIEGDLNLFAS